MKPTSHPTILTDSIEELYEDAPSGYLYTSPDSRILKVNRTFLRWTGYAREEVLGRSFADLLTPGGKIFHQTHLAPLYRLQNAVHELALDLVCKGGTLLPTLISAVAKQNETGEILFTRVTVFNATERRRYEDELRREHQARYESERQLAALNEGLEREVARRVSELLQKERELQQGRKMEALGRLAGGVAHDFNNILAGIRGLAEDLKERLEGQSEAQSDLVAMIHASDRALALTKQLVNFSRGDLSAAGPVDPNVVIEPSLALLKRLIGASIILKTDFRAQGKIRMDPSHLEQVVLNLVINSRDAMPEGGTITLTTEDVELPLAGSAAPIPLPAGRYLRLTESDTGTGMSPEVLAHMFEPFFTTKSKEEGSGLGLATVYGLVQKHHGHIEVSSRVNEGTCFHLYLPEIEPA